MDAYPHNGATVRCPNCLSSNLAQKYLPLRNALAYLQPFV